jgi:hypothetical protein
MKRTRPTPLTHEEMIPGDRTVTRPLDAALGAPLVDVLAACQLARTDLKIVMNSSVFPDAWTRESVATLVNHYPRLRAELERQVLRAEAAEAEVDELRADLARKEAALRALLSHLDYRCGPNPVWKNEMEAARAALEGRDE